MLPAIIDQLGQSPWPEREQVIRVGVAILLGGLIGLERELRDKPAGFRTIILICVGACVFGILSQVVGGPDGESTRIAAQVVTGVGFLGAGAILRNRSNVFGLTTAATIWAVAAIGVAVGFGRLPLAVLGTLAILVALFLFDAVEKVVANRRDIQLYHFSAPNLEDMWDRVALMFKAAKLRIRKQNCHQDGESLAFHVLAMGTKADHEQLHKDLLRSAEYELRRA